MKSWSLSFFHSFPFFGSWPRIRKIRMSLLVVNVRISYIFRTSFQGHDLFPFLESHLPQSWIRFFWLQAIVIFICSVVGTIPIYMLCEIEPRSNATFQWTFTLLYFLALLSSIYSIHQAASNLLFFKVLFGALRGVQAFNTWITRPQQFIHPSDLLHKSQSIVQLFSSIEGRLGAVIFVEVLTNMLFAIFGVFQATNIYVALTEVTFGELQLSKLLHGFNSVLIGLLSCSRYLPFFRLGHNILRETKTAKYNIEEAIAKRHQQFSPNQLWQLEQVRENFGRSAAIQPMGLFDLNLSSACTTDGLLITYVVILIQFKLG